MLYLPTENAAKMPGGWILALSLLISCVRIQPQVLDQTTQLENQILGQLQQMERRLILASAVRGSGKIRLSPLAKEATEAAMRRAFNADDIEQFKAAGHLGERSDGQLQLRRLPADREERRWLRQLVDEENHDRLVLMRRVIQLNSDLSDTDLPLVRSLFHRLMLETAKTGQAGVNRRAVHPPPPDR